MTQTSPSGRGTFFRHRITFKRGIVIGLVFIASATMDLLLRRDVGSGGIDIMTGIKSVIFLTCLLWALSRINNIPKYVKMPALPWLLLSILFMISTVYSTIPLITFASALSLFSMLLFFISATKEIGEEDFVRSFLMGIAIVLLISLVLYFALPAFARSTAWSAADHERVDSGRLQGLVGQPNTIGRMAAASGLICYLYWDKLKRTGPAFVVFIVTLSIASLVLSNSKTAIISVVAAISLNWALSRKVRWAIPLLVAVSVLAIIFTIPYASELASHLSRTKNADEVMTATGRTFVWTESIHMIGEQPFLGYGYNTSSVVLAAYAKSIGSYFLPPSAHNTVLQILLSGGIPALILFLWGTIQTFYMSIKNSFEEITALLFFWFLTTFTEPGGFAGVVSVNTFILFIPIAFTIYRLNRESGVQNQSRGNRKRSSKTRRHSREVEQIGDSYGLPSPTENQPGTSPPLHLG